MAVDDTTTRLFTVLWAEDKVEEPVMPEEGLEEEEEQHWGSASSTPHRVVFCDVDVKFKPQRAFLYRSHGFFHQVALTSTNTLSRLGQGEYELTFRQCDGYIPSPRFLRFFVGPFSTSSSSSSSPPPPTIDRSEPLYVGTIIMHELRFPFLRSLVPGLSALGAIVVTLVFGLRILQKRRSTCRIEREMKKSSTTSTSRVGSPMALSSSFSSSCSGIQLKTKEEMSFEKEPGGAAELSSGDKDSVELLVQLPESDARPKDFPKVSPTSDTDGEESVFGGFGLSLPQPLREKDPCYYHKHIKNLQVRQHVQYQQAEEQPVRRSPLTPYGTPLTPQRAIDHPLARLPRPGSAFSISPSSPASAFALIDSPRGAEGGEKAGPGAVPGAAAAATEDEVMMREERRRHGGDVEGEGENLGWVNEYWSLEGSASCRRSWTRDEEESPRGGLEKAEATEEGGGQEGQDVARFLKRTGEDAEQGDRVERWFKDGSKQEED
ncbi:Hypothetical protein NocV09_00702010 [Nannochloropsis oceanica]